MLSLACHNYNKKAVDHILAATFLCQLNTTSGIREDREEESAFRSGKNPWYEIICPGQYLYWWRIIFHALLRNLSILHFTCFEQWNNRSFYFSLQGKSHNTTIMGKKNCGYNPSIVFCTRINICIHFTWETLFLPIRTESFCYASNLLEEG